MLLYRLSLLFKSSDTCLREGLRYGGDGQFAPENWKKAYYALEKAYKKNPDKGNFIVLSKVYLYGKAGQEKDPEKGYEILKRTIASNPDNRHMLYLEGICLLEGLGTPKDIGKAIEIFEKAVSNGSVAASAKLGVLYHEEADYRDIEKSCFHLQRALGFSKDIQQKYNTWFRTVTDEEIGKMTSGQILEKGIEFAKQADMKGNPAVIMAKELKRAGYSDRDIAKMKSNTCSLRRTREQNRLQAERWLQKAAEMGETEAYSHLGTLALKNGDMESAIKYLKNNTDVIFEYADKLRESDPPASLHYYETYISLGEAFCDKEYYSIALDDLSVTYFYGKDSLPVNYDKAAEYSRQGYESGSFVSSLIYASMLAKGKGPIRQDLYKALAIFAELSHEDPETVRKHKESLGLYNM